MLIISWNKCDFVMISSVQQAEFEGIFPFMKQAKPEFKPKLRRCLIIPYWHASADSMIVIEDFLLHWQSR